MAALSRITHPLSRLRGRLRFRLWVLRSRVRLARAGCSLEVHAPSGASFDGPPWVLATRQPFLDPPTGRGSLRIEIGAHCHLGLDLAIEVLPAAHNVLALGDGVVFQNGVRVTLFGGEVHVGSWTQVRDGVLLKSSGRLSCGEHVLLTPFTQLNAHEEVSVGSRVSLGQHTVVFDSDHVADGSDVHFMTRPVVADPVLIGDNAWVGAHTVITRGARIGRNSVVAAGSVVREGVHPDGWLLAGAPATPRRELSEGAPGGEG
jgi:acetyltransferase-like isoleucine patch superfamily enzyme